MRGVTRLAVGGAGEHGHQEEAQAEQGANARHMDGAASWAQMRVCWMAVMRVAGGGDVSSAHRRVFWHSTLGRQATLLEAVKPAR